jgi:membrane protein YqaA with SNARE-associated domain
VERPSSTSSESVAPSVSRLLARLVLGLAALLIASAVLAHTFRSELQAIGHAFVERFGVPGMVLGTVIADGLHFPVPPQFYMLMGITSDVPTLTTLTAVNFGSFVGAWFAYLLARRLSHVKLLARRLERPRELAQSVFLRYGVWAPVVASFLPITYAALCYLSGLSGLSRRGFALVTAIRVPRLIAYYYLVRLGWMGG